MKLVLTLLLALTVSKAAAMTDEAKKTDPPKADGSVNLKNEHGENDVQMSVISLTDDTNPPEETTKSKSENGNR